MKPGMRIVSTPFLAFALLACGGAQKSAPAESAAPPAAAPPAEAAAPAPAAEAAKPAVTTKLGPNVTPDGVVFNFKPGSKPKKLFLAGTFNAWNPADPNFLMKDDDGDGIYTIIVKLKPGDYQYKYVADGNWLKDPDSPYFFPDGYGGQNSKFDVR